MTNHSIFTQQYIAICIKKFVYKYITFTQFLLAPIPFFSIFLYINSGLCRPSPRQQIASRFYPSLSSLLLSTVFQICFSISQVSSTNWRILPVFSMSEGSGHSYHYWGEQYSGHNHCEEARGTFKKLVEVYFARISKYRKNEATIWIWKSILTPSSWKAWIYSYSSYCIGLFYGKGYMD